MIPKVRMFYVGLSTDFSTAAVENCFEQVATQVSCSKFQVPTQEVGESISNKNSFGTWNLKLGT
jgi:hypothetical protein